MTQPLTIREGYSDLTPLNPSYPTGMVMALLRFERHKEAVIAAKESVKQCPGQARTFLLIAHATSRYPEESSKLRERAKVRMVTMATTRAGIPREGTSGQFACKSICV